MGIEVTLWQRRVALEGQWRWVSAAAAASTSAARRALASDNWQRKVEVGFRVLFESSIIVLNRYVQLRDNFKGKTRRHNPSMTCSWT